VGRWETGDALRGLSAEVLHERAFVVRTQKVTVLGSC